MTLRRKPRRTSKYGVAPREERTFKGTLFDSKLEARYAAKLELMARMNLPPDQKPKSIRRQVSVPLEVNGKLICVIRVDFLVEFWDGHEEYHEVKGFETNEWKIKHNLFRALLPERRYVVIRRA